MKTTTFLQESDLTENAIACLAINAEHIDGVQSSSTGGGTFEQYTSDCRYWEDKEWEQVAHLNEVEVLVSSETIIFKDGREAWSGFCDVYFVSDLVLDLVKSSSVNLGR